MNCVASGAPMITVGLTVMRRRALKAWLLVTLDRHGIRKAPNQPAVHQPLRSSGANCSQSGSVKIGASAAGGA